MTPAAFSYHAPSTLSEALRLLEDDRAMPLAGGQSLMPGLIARAIVPGAIVDLNRIQDFPGIELGLDRLRTGALVRLQQVVDHPGIAHNLPLLHQAVSHVGHRAIRNRGTLVGSLCQLDPWAEVPLVACALEASLLIAGPSGLRQVRFSDFAVAPNRPLLSPGELMVAADWPLWRSRHGAGFSEVARRPNDPALACAAALILLDDNRRIQRAALAIGAVCPLPIRCHQLEALLAGKAADEVTAITPDMIAADLSDHLIRDDALADAAYRRHLAPIVATRAVEQALSRAR